ncbi:unnamed protein product [Soboliphyme baturini]|uniref:Uncharacterized protein n=1 Tax=Soboliphyme baturini TaxID=241478 RepID=A0A183IH62_9BILA|nr:unnamed protein product [Soboliphyme baturini]
MTFSISDHNLAVGYNEDHFGERAPVPVKEPLTEERCNAKCRQMPNVEVEPDLRQRARATPQSMFNIYLRYYLNMPSTTLAIRKTNIRGSILRLDSTSTCAAAVLFVGYSYLCIEYTV